MSLLLSRVNGAVRSSPRKLFVPDLHLWYRPRLVGKESWLVDIGLTDRGLQDLGDITRMESSSKASKCRVNEEVLRIEWDGHVITTADELYHTVWENVSGQCIIRTPVSGRVEYVMNDDDDDSANDVILDQEDVLVTVSTSDSSSLQKVIQNLVDQDQYMTLIKKQPLGMFHTLEGLSL